MVVDGLYWAPGCSVIIIRPPPQRKHSTANSIKPHPPRLLTDRTVRTVFLLSTQPSKSKGHSSEVASVWRGHTHLKHSSKASLWDRVGPQVALCDL